MPTRIVKIAKRSSTEHLAIEVVGRRIAGLQFKGSLEVELRLRDIPFPVKSDDRSRLVSFRKGSVELQRLLGGRDRLVAHFSR